MLIEIDMYKDVVSSLHRCIFEDYFMVLRYGDWGWLDTVELQTYLKRESKRALIFSAGVRNSYITRERITEFTMFHPPDICLNVQKQILDCFKGGFGDFFSCCHVLNNRYSIKNHFSCIPVFKVNIPF